MMNDKSKLPNIEEFDKKFAEKKLKAKDNENFPVS